MIKVKKLHPDAVLPKKAHDTDAGYDVVAVDDGVVDPNGEFIEYHTGICIEPPPGWHVLIHPRSSVSNFDLVLANSIGLVDNGYRGELVCRFKLCAKIWKNPDGGLIPWIHGADINLYKKGDKVAQLVIEKTNHMDFKFVEELGESDRNAGGFGSSGS